MAVGTFTLTYDGKLALLNGNIDPDGDTLVGVLVDNAHTPSLENDNLYSDISGNECTDGDYAPVVLGGVAMNRTGATVKLDANAVAYGDPVTISARYIYVVRRAGASLVAGDLILGYMDLNNGGSANVGSTNAEFTVDWDAANGLFTA